MSEHARAQAHLYEFVNNELSAEVRLQIEKHLTSCSECSEDVKKLSSFLLEMNRATVDYSARQPEEYWNTFAYSVQAQIKKEKEQHQGIAERFVEWLDSVTTFRPRDIAIVGAMCAVVLLTLIAGKEFMFKHEQIPQQTASLSSTPVVDSEFVRLHDYFRRSRTLLTGLANLKTEEYDQVDLQAERTMSRSLLHQARMLRQQPLDSRSERLISDMEKILLKVANSDSMHYPPQLEIIRGGIERVNLLYKIRRAESVFKSPNIMYANYREEKESQ